MATYTNNPLHAYSELISNETLLVQEDKEDTFSKKEKESLSEIELQSHWFSGDFGDQFITEDGKKIVIHSFGHWNHSSGPDFTETNISIDGKPLMGDIELDTNIRDWEQHGHAINPEFDKVILHLHLVGTKDKTTFIRSHSNKEIPQIKLSLHQLTNAPLTKSELPEAKIGTCAPPLAQISQTDINTLLESAAYHRLIQKSERIHQISKYHGEEQALYQSIAQALGYRNNQVQMRILSQRLPLSYLRQNNSIKESLLLGASGFLENTPYDSQKSDTQTYMRTLWNNWWKQKDKFTNHQASKWKIRGSRPANHPQRRIAALVTLVDHWTEFIEQLQPTTSFSEKALHQFLSELSHPYWSQHYTLKSKPTEKPIKLIGQSRIREILANIIYPYLVPQQHELWGKYLTIPATASNQKTRRAVIRLFGNQVKPELFHKHLYQQQALLQIYTDYCMSQTSGCLNCKFPEKLASIIT